MKMFPVESSALKSVGFDGVTLQLQFPKGGFIRFKGVPQSTFDGLLIAESKGTFYNQQIRNSFEIDQDAP
jgi:hypothetical protein|tara:strand:- start:220 stop:429 length:210 start_codon:yes stop_codon:yes gene_type:complete